MKKTVKLLSLVLAFTLLASIFAACSKDDEVLSGGKYTYWAALSSTAAQTITSYNELMMYKEIAKRTGIEVDFIHPAQGSTGQEAFQILLSSGDYPDMIEYAWATYAGGPDQAIKDGVIIAINDYMEKYAPNYYNYMEGEKGEANNYLYKAQSLTNEGNYFGFRNLNVGTYRGFYGFYLRADLLEKWGLDVPVTIDDWTFIFKTAKENGFKYPFTSGVGPFSIDFNAGSFSNAWKVGNNFYLDGDSVKFGPFEAGFKDFLKQMNEWYKAGYIDPDFITNKSTEIEGAMTNGTSMATLGYVGSGIGRLIPAMLERDPSYKLVGAPTPVLNEGDTGWFQEVQAEAADATIAITVSCGIDNKDRYKEAIKWCDYVYSEEGDVLKCFGIEGDTFTVETDEEGEKHYVYTDKIKDHEKIGAHSVEAALYHFMRPANSPGLNQHTDYLMGFYPYKEQLAALEVWNKDVQEAKKHKLPPLSYTSEEASKKAEIESANKDNLNALLTNIVIGKIAIDKYDEEIDKLKNAGYGELLKIQQAAYDRYLELIK